MRNQCRNNVRNQHKVKGKHRGRSYKSEPSIRGGIEFVLQGVTPERKITVVAEDSIYRRSCLALRDKSKTNWELWEVYGHDMAP